MSSPEEFPVPQYETLALTRRGRLLTITLNMPQTLNGVTDEMHEELSEVFTYAGKDPHSDVLLLTGPEPDMAWHRFTRTVVDMASALGVRHFAHLGAYPFATPHTRPARISVTSPSQDVLMRVPYLRSSIDVPERSSQPALRPERCTSHANSAW